MSNDSSLKDYDPYFGNFYDLNRKKRQGCQSRRSHFRHPEVSSGSVDEVEFSDSSLGSIEPRSM